MHTQNFTSYQKPKAKSENELDCFPPACINLRFQPPGNYAWDAMLQPDVSLQGIISSLVEE